MPGICGLKLSVGSLGNVSKLHDFGDGAPSTQRDEYEGREDLVEG